MRLDQVERERDIARREGNAVAPRHAPPQGDGVHRDVLVRTEAGGQPGLHAPGLVVEVEQRLEHALLNAEPNVIVRGPLIGVKGRDGK
jgi:hypothetical protein